MVEGSPMKAGSWDAAAYRGKQFAIFSFVLIYLTSPAENLKIEAEIFE